MPGMKYKEPSVSDYKPNCYTCRWRGTLTGSAHSKCQHPEIKGGNTETTAQDHLMNIMAIFASVGRVSPVCNAPAARRLDVRGSEHGIRNGWFNWPWDFDPVWLKSCTGWAHFTEACVDCPHSLRCISGALETRPHDHCSAKTWEWRWKKNEESKLG